MKLVVKIKSILLILSAVVLTISILLTCSVITHTDNLNVFYNSLIEKECYKSIYIYDCKGKPIYTGGFSDDEILRQSTFHIIGDRNKSISNSLLTTTYPSLNVTSVYKGFSPTEKEYTLTIDSKLQKSAHKLLSRKGYRGCIIVSDYITGEIKAMVSTPSVDVYNTDYIEEGAFLNKATLTYPPGSIFKSVTVAAALEKNPSAKNYSFTCSGKSEHISCYNRTAHGKQKLSDMLSNSCNCGISTFAKKYITPDYLDSYTKSSNIINGSVLSDFKVKEGSIDSSDDLMWAANGQSKNMVTPLGVIAFYNSIANNGYQVQLKLIQNNTETKTSKVMSSATAAFISDSLSSVTKNLGINCFTFGKTGTAELDNAESHAWFVCCLDDEDAPPYTVLMFIEHGGLSISAKNLSREFINNTILNKEGLV